PSTYGIFLEPAKGKIDDPNGPIGQTGGASKPAQAAEVWTGNRRMRLNVIRSMDVADLKPGTMVRLTDGNLIVEDCGYPDHGDLALVRETLPDRKRVLATDHHGE